MAVEPAAVVAVAPVVVVAAESVELAAAQGEAEELVVVSIAAAAGAAGTPEVWSSETTDSPDIRLEEYPTDCPSAADSPVSVLACAAADKCFGTATALAVEEHERLSGRGQRESWIQKKLWSPALSHLLESQVGPEL